tara:strand:+ start:9820 stop:10251 length:432 start_codon:yes stop_codon:yes gene_type:complete
MKKNIPPSLLFIFSVLSTVFVLSCEDNDKIANSDQDQDTIAIVDTVRFGDLTTLFENRCYHCHSEPEYSFYALNLDTYENTMLGSQHGPIVVPFEPEQSLLYTKCSGEHTEGERMPQDDLNFFDDKPEKLQLIYDWIHFGCLE